MDERYYQTEMPVYLYRIYGLIISSSCRFKNLFPVSSGIPDISFSYMSAPPLSAEWKKSVPAYASQSQTEGGESRFSLYRMNGYDVVHIAGSIDYYIWPKKIVAHLLDPEYAFLVEIHLLGWILSIWLELHHIPTIHASAVVTKHGAIGFISTNKGGKSALAAAFVKEGYPLLTDDVLPLEEQKDAIFFGRPGYPQMRMWPDEAVYFLGRYQDLGIIHPQYSKCRVPVGPPGFGTFMGDKQQLKALYIPERQSENTDIVIEPISPKTALIELIRNSFSARIVEALGLEVQRMHFFAGLVLHVPVRRLIYPSGFQFLPVVREALERDVESL
jgi:hypothetical protein